MVNTCIITVTAISFTKEVYRNKFSFILIPLRVNLYVPYDFTVVVVPVTCTRKQATKR